MQIKPMDCWWPYWENQYLPSILSLRKSFELMLGNLSDGVPEAEEYLASLKRPNVPEEVMNDADNVAGDIHEHIASVRQQFLNMMCVGLWHLVEQQLLELLRRRFLEKEERYRATIDPKFCHNLCKLEHLQTRLERQNPTWKLTTLESWKKLDELRLVTNVVKHGFGQSAAKLYEVRKDLFDSSFGILNAVYFDMIHGRSGEIRTEDAIELALFVTDQDLAVYFDKAVEFWPEFSRMINPEELKMLR